MRIAGFVFAVISVIAPALPLGPVFAPPWTPLAVLWLAYGYANTASADWRAQVALFALGLVHDQFAGGPFGLYAILYLAAFVVGRMMTSMMRSPNLLSLWGGFIAMCAGLCVVATLFAPWAMGGRVELAPFMVQCAVTAILFPIARHFYEGLRTAR
jgi:hypothetical protein